MEKRGSSLLKWSFNGVEMILGLGTAISLSVTVMIFVNGTFQSKAEALDFKVTVESRITKVEQNIDTMRADMSGIRSDTSYIRGYLESNRTPPK